MTEEELLRSFADAFEREEVPVVPEFEEYLKENFKGLLA